MEKFDIYLHSPEFIYICNESFDIYYKKDIGIKEEKIVFIGDYKEGKNKIGDSTRFYNLKGKIILPGFIDPHTHPVYSDDRILEFEERLLGKKYLELLKEERGILYTVKKTREKSKESLKKIVKERLRKFLEHGTLTIEAKTGYGLSVAEEIKHLEILYELKKELPLDIKITALFAHAVPKEKSKEEYIEEILNYGLKEASKYADFCDVFVEKGVYTKEEGKRILLEAKKYGMLPRIHADELSNSGGGELALEVNAISCDHLEYTPLNILKKMRNKNISCILLPATSFYMRLPFAKGRKMLDLGLSVSLATDHNPGTSFTFSQIFVAGLSIFLMGFKIEEAIKAITINSAKSLLMDDKKGSLEIGKDADLVVFDIKRLSYLFYDFYNVKKPVLVIKNGKEVINEID
ncbi:MAG: imidazolonepropionase [candidate division WOR-3 bacterium]